MLQWGRGWLPRKVHEELEYYWAESWASMGPRLVTAEGLRDATLSDMSRYPASMGPRLVTAEGVVVGAEVSEEDIASMGPRLVTAEGLLQLFE